MVNVFQRAQILVTLNKLINKLFSIDFPFSLRLFNILYNTEFEYTNQLTHSGSLATKSQHICRYHKYIIKLQSIFRPCLHDYGF